MSDDYTVKGYTWKCHDGAKTVDVWESSPEAKAAMTPVMEKMRELEKLGAHKGNLFKPAFTYNFPGYPRHHPINLAAFPQRTVDFDMHSIEPGYGFPVHLHDYADESYVVIGGKGKIVLEGEILDAEQHDVFYIPPGKWHCAFNPAENKETFHLFILQAPRVSDELSEMGYVEITKSQWDQLGLPKKAWEKKA